ncbi:MAG: hypothetical protein AABW67_02010 [Nanoarchaeota archaeon]
MSETNIQSFFLQYLGDNPKMRILDFLMDNFSQDFSLPQIAEGGKVAYTTLIDLLPKLLKQEIITETRKIGKSTLYKINLDNPVAKALFVIDIKLSEASIEKVMAV